jgi:hypothetical protein
MVRFKKFSSGAYSINVTLCQLPLACAACSMG